MVPIRPETAAVDEGIETVAALDPGTLVSLVTLADGFAAARREPAEDGNAWATRIRAEVAAQEKMDAAAQRLGDEIIEFLAVGDSVKVGDRHYEVRSEGLIKYLAVDAPRRGEGQSSAEMLLEDVAEVAEAFIKVVQAKPIMTSRKTSMSFLAMTGEDSRPPSNHYPDPVRRFLEGTPLTALTTVRIGLQSSRHYYQDALSKSNTVNIFDIVNFRHHALGVLDRLVPDTSFLVLEQKDADLNPEHKVKRPIPHDRRQIPHEGGADVIPPLLPGLIDIHRQLVEPIEHLAKRIPALAPVLQLRRLSRESVQDEILLSRAVDTAQRILFACVGDNEDFSFRGPSRLLTPLGRAYDVVPRGPDSRTCRVSTGGKVLLGRDPFSQEPAATLEDHVRFIEDVLAKLPEFTPLMEDNSLGAQAHRAARSELSTGVADGLT